MLKKRGSAEYKKFLEGKRLSRSQAIKAQCYMCNGEHEGSPVDCQGAKSCPLYMYFPYKGH